MRLATWPVIVALAALLLPLDSRAACKGDCDANGSVSSADLELSTDIVLGKELALECPSLDFDLDGVVTAQDLVAAIKANVDAGCAVAVHVTGQVKNQQGAPVQGAAITVGAANESSVHAIQASMTRGIHVPGMPKRGPAPPLMSQSLALTATVQGTTDANGNFSLNLDPIEIPSAIVVDVSFQSGTDPSVDSSRTVPATSGNVNAGLITLPSPALGKFTPVGGAGATADGDVDVEDMPGEVETFYANALDPDADKDAFPGDFSEVGKLPLNSSGFQWLEAQDANGDPVDDLSNAAIIRGKLEETQWHDLVDLQDGTDRIEVPLYTFNEATAMWQQDGTGWLEDENGTVLPEDAQALILQGVFPGKVFVAYATEHLSWFNVDYAYIGPWPLARLAVVDRNTDCLFDALTLARRILFSQVGIDAFAAVNMPGANILQELADGRGPSIVIVDFDGLKHGAYRGDAGGSETRIELARSFWDVCASPNATQDDRRSISLLLAAAVLHETAHWKDDLKKFPSDNGQEDDDHDTPGEEGEALERAIFGGVLDVNLDPNFHATLTRDGVPVSTELRDAWLNPGNWPPAMSMHEHPVQRTLPPSPITVTISTEGSVFELGAPIPVEVTYENVSASPVTVLSSIQLEGHPLYFDVIKQDGGDRMPFLGPEYKMVESNLQFTTLQPGATLTLATDLVVGPDGFHYALEGAQTYEVTAFYEPHRGVELTQSNTLIITVGEGGSLDGHVTDATSGDGIADATVIVRRDGIEIERTFTDGAGDYMVAQLPPGDVEVEARAPGFLHVTVSPVHLDAGETTTQNFSLSPLLAEGEIQLVLTWGDIPEDLDSHLWLPMDRPFHVAYYEEGSDEGCPFAFLNTDETDGFGPETITINHLIGNGIYRYAVNNYSEEVGFAEAATRPTVRIVRIGHDDVVIEAPIQGSGEWWHVLDIDSVTGAITIVNEIVPGDPSPYSDTDAGCPDEHCHDAVDNDDDGAVDCADSDCETACDETFACFDGYDNDLNELIDCADPACDWFCDESFGTNCFNSVDDDHDGVLDCADADCAAADICIEGQNCGDCTDNDVDGLVDCGDPDCAGFIGCSVEDICNDARDNDLDGAMDCDDSDCTPCTEDCTTNPDDDRDGLVNCADPDCIESFLCDEFNCADCLDNDGDLNVDCADSDCDAAANCTEGDHCYDGADNDGDVATDCADSDCACACARCGVGSPDTDGDGMADSCDNCPAVPNNDQRDQDIDGTGDRCDTENCTDQYDNDGDSWPNCFDSDCVGTAACDEALHCNDFVDNDRDCLIDCADADCNGTCPAAECCPPGFPNACHDFVDNDGDRLYDCQDSDCFGDPDCQEAGHCDDGLDNDYDNHVDCLDSDCPRTDTDADTIPDCDDNCPDDPNPGQFDSDSDIVGDACDGCPLDANFSQDDCDGDGWPDDCDNCPHQPNADQADDDNDSEGDICDGCTLFEFDCNDSVDEDCDGVTDAADFDCGGPALPCDNGD